MTIKYVELKAKMVKRKARTFKIISRQYCRFTKPPLVINPAQ